VLAAAQRAGAVTPEQVDLIARGLGSVDRRGFDPADLEAGERLLTDFATTFGPKDLKNLTDKTVEAIDPDGTLPGEELNWARRFFRLRTQRDGAYVGEFRLTGAVGAKLAAVLGPLARPRVDTDISGEGAISPASARRLSRGRAQLRATDARRPRRRLRPAAPRRRAARVRRHPGHRDHHHHPRRPARPARVRNHQRRHPAVGPRGAETGRASRHHPRRAHPHRRGPRPRPDPPDRPPTQTYALTARDAGCSFPGCAAPPQWCERHHIVPWVDGGATNLDNLTLLCGYHHHNFAARGWTCQLNTDRLPTWIPPAWINPERQPMINGRIAERRMAKHRRRGVVTMRAFSPPDPPDPPDPRTLLRERTPALS